jgi:hypothetical protein
MGRETVAVAHWKGETAKVKALLEAAEIILRGEIRARISRANISSISVDEDTLQLVTAGSNLRLELGNSEAMKWAAVLSKPPPTLAQKLGIDEARRAFVIGHADDEEFANALSDASTQTRNDAAVLVAILKTDADLSQAISLGQVPPICPIWCVYGKGKFATISDTTIRTVMRANGFIDNKTSGISDKMTATRYQFKAASSPQHGEGPS